MRRVVGLLAAVVVAVVVLPAPPAAAVVVHEERVVFGTSVDGRALVAVHRWTDGATAPTLVVGSMHGDERAGMRVVRRLRTAALPAGVDLWLVRTMNPDGTAADRRANANGVDLNRNFPAYWQRSGRGTSQWSGPSAASEPETRAMMSLLRTVDPHTVLSFHQPLFAVDSYRAKSMSLVRRLSRLTGLPIRSLDCHGGCHGTMTDWVNTRLSGRAVTVEVGRTASDSRLRRATSAVLRTAAS